MAALAVVAGAAAAAGGSPRASASAFGVLVKIAGGSATGSGTVSAPPKASANGGFAYPGDGSAVSVSGTQVSVQTGPGAGSRATASAVVEGVSLFGGEVTVGQLTASATASAHADGSSGDLGRSAVVGLTVAGSSVEAFANRRIALGDWGYAVVLEQAVAQGGAPDHAYRGFVTALHVRLTDDHGGLPAGSEILVGYAEAAVRSPLDAPAGPEDEATAPDGQGGGKADGGKGGAQGLADEPSPGPPGSAQPGMPAIVRDPPAGVRPDITGKGYVFPVYGPASFSSDFGYPRAHTGWHHGNDIFAPLGAPVLAVADGTLFSVGWNAVGGWRLWLRDRQGNEYYYAHLSAYSPLARDGTPVRAGDVIGFVGDSGDARGTPSHLHFEIHPAALLGLGYDGVIDPYAYLLGWRQAQDLAIGVAPSATEVEATPAPEPAAGLLETQDIASVSGLVPGGLAEALTAPSLAGDGAFAPVVAPSLVGSEPGFDGAD